MQQIKDTNLLYQEEHLMCGNYNKTANANFSCLEAKRGEKKRIEATANYLIILLQGRMELTSYRFGKRVINQEEMVLLDRSSIMLCEYLEDSRLLLLTFDKLSSVCEKLYFKELTLLSAGINYNLDPLPLRPPLDMFCQLMLFYLSKKQSVHILMKSSIRSCSSISAFSIPRKSWPVSFIPCSHLCPTLSG